MKKINILHLVNGLAIGGAELKLLELVTEIQRRFPDEYNQLVCSVGQGGPLEKQFAEIGIPPIVFNKRNRFDIRLVFRVADLIRTQKVHIIQTTLFYADVIGALAANLVGNVIHLSWETVSHSHGYMHDRFYRNWAYRLAMKRVYRIIAVSEEIKTSLMIHQKIPSSKITVIHYGVNTEKFLNNSRSRKSKQENYPIIGIVGRLDPIKGHKYLLMALEKVKKVYPKLKCLIIGDGPIRGELETLSESLGLRNNVEFLGFRRDVQSLLGLMDIFVLPSLSEGLPNSILEAMASSVPVVATNVGGIPEVITDKKNGLLVPPKDVDKLAEAILQLAGDSALRQNIIHGGLAMVSGEFSLDHQINRFRELYQLSIANLV